MKFDKSVTHFCCCCACFISSHIEMYVTTWSMQSLSCMTVILGTRNSVIKFIQTHPPSAQKSPKRTRYRENCPLIFFIWKTQKPLEENSLVGFKVGEPFIPLDHTHPIRFLHDIQNTRSLTEILGPFDVFSEISLCYKISINCCCFFLQNMTIRKLRRERYLAVTRQIYSEFQTKMRFFV